MRGSGGPNGARVYWPAGLQELAPADRIEALERGYWADGDHIVTVDGRRLHRPVEAARLRGALDEPCGPVSASGPVARPSTHPTKEDPRGRP